MNNIVLIGRLGNDPALNYTATGKAVANFNLATDSIGTDKPDWHRVVVWEKQAENVCLYLKKGKKAAVQGRLTYRQWEKDGVKHTQAEIIASQVEFLSPKEDGEQPGPAPSAPAPSRRTQQPLDEIPF